MQSVLKDVERLLKLDSTNPTLLAQKQKLLTQEIGDTKKAVNLKSCSTSVKRTTTKRRNF